MAQFLPYFPFFLTENNTNPHHAEKRSHSFENLYSPRPTLLLSGDISDQAVKYTVVRNRAHY